MEIIMLIGVALGGMAVVLFFKIKSWYVKYLRDRKFDKAIRKEEEAYFFLEKNGYEIIEYQPELCYNVYVDEETCKIKVTPDYIVKKRGKIYIAEVKTGEYAPDISSRGTRRQLLEYYIASEMSGILLVDMESKIIKEIRFEIISLEKESEEEINKVIIIILIGVIIILSLYIIFSK